MKKSKYIITIFLFICMLFIKSTVVNASDISYKTEFFSSIDTAIYINGLDSNLESGYEYYIYTSQDNTISADKIISEANLAHCDSLKYDSDNNQFYLKTSAYNVGIFEKFGDYYAYIVKGKITHTDTFSLIDGPTKLERPALLPNGNRITAYFNENGASYSINQYDYYTKMFGTDRKVNFYLGKLDDTNILTKLSSKDKDAYDVLYSYAKNNQSYVFSGSFDTTNTGVLHYNIWKDYPNLKSGEYYFVYYKLDDQNGTYAEFDDVQAYTVSQSGILDKFSTYTPISKPDESTKPDEPTKSDDNNSQPESTTQNTSEKKAQEDNTTKVGNLPYTGQKAIILLFIVTIFVCGIFAYFKYNKLKDI